MSDPLGRHYCKHAGDVDEHTGVTMCKLTKKKVQCLGVIEECPLEPDWDSEIEARKLEDARDIQKEQGGRIWGEYPEEDE